MGGLGGQPPPPPFDLGFIAFVILSENSLPGNNPERSPSGATKGGGALENYRKLAGNGPIVARGG